MPRWVRVVPGVPIARGSGAAGGHVKVLALLAGLGLTGCPDNYGPDEPCNATSDCQSGLQCVAPTSGPADSGCTPLNKRCTLTCKTDKDCNYPGGGSCILRSCSDDSTYCIANGL